MNLSCDKCGKQVRPVSGIKFVDVWCVVCSNQRIQVARHYFCCKDHAHPDQYDPSRPTILVEIEGGPG